MQNASEKTGIVNLTEAVNGNPLPVLGFPIATWYFSKGQ